MIILLTDNLTRLINTVMTRLIRDTTRTNNVARLVALAATRSKGLKRFCLRQRCCKAWRKRACNCAYKQCCNVTRVIALATTRSREIVLTTTMSQGSRLQTILQGSERFCLRQQCRETYRPCSKKVAQIKEIVLTTTRGKDPLLLMRQRWGDHKSNVTRFIALKTTKSREIMLTTPMLRDSGRLRFQRQSCCTVLETPMSQDSERSRLQGRCRIMLATLMSQDSKR